MKNAKTEPGGQSAFTLIRPLVSVMTALCVAMTSSAAAPATASATAYSLYDYKYYKTGSWTYRTLEDGTLAKLTYYWSSEDAELEVPESIDGCTVVVLETSACTGHDEIESAAFPDTLTDIGNLAFENCTSLTSVVLPEALDRIGAQAFYNCSSLESAWLPEGIGTIGNKAFPETTVIYGYEDTPAESYCAKHGNTFVSLGSPQDDDGGSSSGNDASSSPDSSNSPSSGNGDTSAGSSPGSAKSVKVTKASVKLAKSTCTYNGKARKPKVRSVKAGGKKIGKSHYSVSYSNNVEPGTAKVKVTFKNGYSGSVTKKFQIRLGRARITLLRSIGDTMVAVNSKVPGCKTDDRLTQDYGVTLQLRYRVKGTKKWKTWKKYWLGDVDDIYWLTIGKTYQVQVRATKKVNGKRRYGKWSKARSVKVTRYGTR